MVAKSQRYPTTQRFLLAALWFELLVLTVKLFIGLQSNSLALSATAIYSAIATVSAGYAIVATYNLRQAGRIVWGHSRWESATAFLLVGLSGFSGVYLATEALRRLAASAYPGQIPPITTTVGQLQGLLFFGLGSLGLAWLQKRWAKQHRILALAINADRVLLEALVSLAILLVLPMAQQGYTWLDPLVALGLSIGAAYSIWKMLQRQMPLLIQQVAIAPEAIAQIVGHVDGVTHCYQIESRGIVGRQVLISLRLVIHPEFLGMEGRIIQAAEAALRETYGPVKVTVQVDGDWEGLENSLPHPATVQNERPQIDRF